MTLRFRAASALIAVLVVSVIATACGGGSNTTDIIQTTQAQIRRDNATATALALASGVDTGPTSRADEFRESFNATATARALEAESATPGAGGTETPDGFEMPEGPALTDADSPTVNIGDRGTFDPEVIKVKVGTTVTWVNERRTASTTTSLEGEAEQWDSGSISKPTFGEAARFQHTFTIPGCHEYGSFTSGDRSRGAVCVEE